MTLLRTACVVVFLSILGGPVAQAQPVIYVDSASTADAPDGASWSTAYPVLQDALDEANANPGTDYEVRVAEGTYYPDEDGEANDGDGDDEADHTDGSEAEAFTLTRDGVTILGGYPSGGGSRDPTAHVTTLSGDIGQDDDPFAPNTDSDKNNETSSRTDHINGSNSNHVVVLDGGASGAGSTTSTANITDATVLRGLTITGGRASGDGANASGGGIYCDGQGTDNECSPTLATLTVVGNAAADGGGIYLNGRSGGVASPTIAGTVLVGNTAGRGGGVFSAGVNGAPVIRSTVLVNNGGKNGGEDRGGGIYHVAGTLSVVNATITDNGASAGGGIFVNDGPDDTGRIDVANSILWGNRPDDTTGEIEAGGENASGSVEYSIVQEGVDDVFTTNGVISDNPRFAGGGSLAGADERLGTVDDRVNLGLNSPALDAGVNGAVVEDGGDVTGADRTQDFNGDGTATVNMGAYEAFDVQPPSVSARLVTSITGATQWGTLNPGGGEAVVRFRVSTPASTSSTVVDIDTVRGAVTRLVHGTARELAGGQEYDLTLAATSADGKDRSSPISVRVPSPSLQRNGGDQAVPIVLKGRTEVVPVTASSFFVRTGGRGPAAFRSLALTTQETDAEGTLGRRRLEATVPDSMITARGVDYYMRLEGDASFGSATLTVPDGAGETTPPRPLSMPVTFDALASGGYYPSERYRMVSIPATGDAKAALTDAYGPYRPDRWRVLQWDAAANRYRDFSELAPADLRPGRAFWLVTEQGTDFSLSGGQTVDASTPTTVSLRPGWNQIGTPYGFAVPWDRVRAASNLTSAQVDGPFRYRNGTYRRADALETWDGYFVFNATDSTETLVIPPVGTDAPMEQSVASAAGAKAPTNKADQGYTLRATVHTAGQRQSVRMGLRPGARDGRDALDVAQPPPVASGVRLSVLESTNGDRVPYARSVKSIGGNGRTWTLQLSRPAQSNGPATVRLALSETGTLPEGQSRSVFDADTGRRVASGTTFSVDAGETRTLTVVVGTDAYAEQHSDGATTTQYDDALRGNSPNPFTEKTTLTYTLSQAQPVTIAVYNLLGRRVRTLVDERKDAGRHQVRWDGTNQYDTRVGSGVYFVRMEAGRTTATQKVMLVR